MATRLTMLAFCGPVLVNELDFDGLDALFRVDEGMLGRECRDLLYSRYIQVKQSYKSSSRSWFRVYKDQELHWGRRRELYPARRLQLGKMSFEPRLGPACSQWLKWPTAPFEPSYIALLNAHSQRAVFV